jgi:hypothetical protein
MTVNSNQDNHDNYPPENDFVKKIIKEGGHPPPNITVVYGYVGSSDSVSTLRLYKDLSFKEYYEINKNDIITWKENEKDPYGGTSVFVNSDVEIKVVYVEVIKVRARFLAGVISRRIRRQQRRLPKVIPSQAVPGYAEHGILGTYLEQTWCGTCVGDTCEVTWCGTCVGCPTMDDTCVDTCAETCEYSCAETCPDPSCAEPCFTEEGFPSCFPTCDGCVLPQEKSLPSKTQTKSKRSR